LILVREFENDLGLAAATFAAEAAAH